MIDIQSYRRFFAEEIEAVARLSSAALIDALATVPREGFLPPGPWTVLADGDLASMSAGMMPSARVRTRTTVDSDPRRVYHNIVVAIDPSRQLFNGQPSTVSTWIDAIDPRPGQRVLHIGAGLGYYTAIMAHTVGPSGRVVAYEVDEALGAEVRQNLASMPWVNVRIGNAAAPLDEPFDAILVNAGVTHPLDVWLDALVPGGHMILPLTSAIPAMGPTIGKGLVFLLTKQHDGSFTARVIAFVSIYSAVGIRDEQVNERLGKAMMGGPMQWTAVTGLRRDAHDAGPSCWLHTDSFCLQRF